VKTAVVAIACVFALAGTTTGSATTRDRHLAQALAFVRRHCPYAPDTTMWMHGWSFNALSGNCAAGDGRDQRVWFFVGGRFVGNDSRTSSKDIVGVWRDGNTIAFLYVLYRRADSNCCPTGGGKIVRFRWNAHRVIRLDALPARQLGNVAIGR
jgi:hypothetical protein